MPKTQLIKDHHLWTRDTIKNISGDVTLDIAGDINLETGGNDIHFKTSGNSYLEWSALGSLIMKSVADRADYFQLQVTSAGATYLSTIDSDGDEAAHLSLVPNGSCIIDRNVSNTSAGTYLGLDIDYDKTEASTSNNTLTGLRINTSNTTATNGTNTMYGIICTSQLTHAADAGTTKVSAGHFRAIGGTNGTSTTYGLQAIAVGGDTNYGLEINCADGGNDLRILSSADNADYFQIATTANGATTLTTVDDGAAVGHLTLDPDGDLIISGADTKIDATKKLYLDGGSDTYITEPSADVMRFVVGGDSLFQVQELGDDGNQVGFLQTAVGFLPYEESFSDDSIIGSGGTDDTHIDFRFGNKAFLAVTGDITNMNLIFPLLNGNFLLHLSYNGDHDITNWKPYFHDETIAEGDGDVLWAGGSAPATTNNGEDIFTFYWDGGNQKCYGVASLAFATP